MLIAVDTGAFLDAVKAFHRLLDLRNKHEDAEVLQILAKEAIKTVGSFLSRIALTLILMLMIG